MIDLKTSSINVTLHFDQRFKKKVNTSYSGIQIPTNVYHEGTGNMVNRHKACNSPYTVIGGIVIL